MQSYWFSKQSKINIIYNISVITITITMTIILANFGKYAISDCPFIIIGWNVLDMKEKKVLNCETWLNCIRHIYTVCVRVGFWRYNFAPVGILSFCWYRMRSYGYKQAKMVSIDDVTAVLDPSFEVNKAKKGNILSASTLNCQIQLVGHTQV